MGSSSSKPTAFESSSDSGVRRSRFKGSRGVFHSSCLSGSHDSDNDNDDPQVSDPQTKEILREGPFSHQTKSDSDQVKAEFDRKVKVQQPDEMTCVSSKAEFDEWGQSSLSDTVSRGGSTSSRAFFSRSLNPSSRFLSRFSFFPGNVSFRLSRATSLSSSRAFPASSTSFTTNDEEELHLQTGPTNGMVNSSERPQACELLPACLSNRSSRRQYEDFASHNLQLNPPTYVFSDNLQDDEITSTQDVARDVDNTRVEFNVNLCSPRNYTGIEGMETTVSDRRIGAREPVERNVRFSRTLSVGRLRDRVLRRSSFPDLTFCPLRQEREVRGASQASRRQALVGGIEATASNENDSILPDSSRYDPSSMSSSLYGSQDYERETSRARQARYHDLLEHRSNFLERRRRIRSQVRALQRLGGRFENLSGHERSCISSGQHRTGHCTCRISTRNSNSNDEASARASISRIVMLAEALFEVLDDIHQQSVVLSSRPFVSSIGSVPAPNEVVESLPLKLYSKLQKHLNDEVALCYICLVEYEEGDSVRILPCHHEFHIACIDKWLKDIHRVCPVCRGDICRSESMPAEN